MSEIMDNFIHAPIPEKKGVDLAKPAYNCSPYFA